MNTCQIANCPNDAEYSVSPGEPWNSWKSCEDHLPPKGKTPYREYRDRVRPL